MDKFGGPQKHKYHLVVGARLASDMLLRKADLLRIDDNVKPDFISFKDTDKPCNLGQFSRSQSKGLYVGQTKGFIYHFQQFSKAGIRYTKLFLDVMQYIVGNFTNDLCIYSVSCVFVSNACSLMWFEGIWETLQAHNFSN